MTEIISEKDWNVTPALNEWYIVFQVKGPINNIFVIQIRKTKYPQLSLRLGLDFDPSKVGWDSEEFQQLFRQDTNRDFWNIEIDDPQKIYKLKGLLEYAYNRYSSG